MSAIITDKITKVASPLTPKSSGPQVQNPLIPSNPPPSYHAAVHLRHFREPEVHTLLGGRNKISHFASLLSSTDNRVRLGCKSEA